MNQPQTHEIPSRILAMRKKTNDTLLILTFSGGGTRAAALSYGVLKGLRDTTIRVNGIPQSLLSEVDLISSVSGGSFTAAYYGLFGDKIFSDYEKKFLKYPMQSELINAWLAPRNWKRLGSELFNRSDLAAEYYDQHLFNGKTFADMRVDAPVIAINTTDISTGQPFSFTRKDMHSICSNLLSYPISRAVAASSAVPGVFSPITLKNFDKCTSTSQTSSAASTVLAFRDKKRYPYLHLVDGGISDNLGIRPVLNMVISEKDNFLHFLKKQKLEKIKNVVIIVVNSADDIPPAIAQTITEPSLEDTIGAVTTLQSRLHNIDTLALLNRKTQLWSQQVNKNTCRKHKHSSCHRITFHTIELNLKQLPPPLAQQTSLYKTSLELPKQQVDTLIYAGQYLLHNSPEFVNLVKKLNK